MDPKAQLSSSYLQGEPTRSSPGRPLDTGLRVEPLVAVRRIKGDDLTNSSGVGELIIVCVCVPFSGPSLFSSNSFWGRVLLLAPLFWTLWRRASDA